jgi:hypothetical protein
MASTRAKQVRSRQSLSVGAGPCEVFSVLNLDWKTSVPRLQMIVLDSTLSLSLSILSCMEKEKVNVL